MASEQQERAAKLAGIEPPKGDRCVFCLTPKDQITFHTEADEREWEIGQICPECWADVFREEE